MAACRVGGPSMREEAGLPAWNRQPPAEPEVAHAPKTRCREIRPALRDNRAGSPCGKMNLPAGKRRLARYSKKTGREARPGTATTLPPRAFTQASGVELAEWGLPGLDDCRSPQDLCRQTLGPRVREAACSGVQTMCPTPNGPRLSLVFATARASPQRPPGKGTGDAQAPWRLFGASGYLQFV